MIAADYSAGNMLPLLQLNRNLLRSSLPTLDSSKPVFHVY